MRHLTPRLAALLLSAVPAVAAAQSPQPRALGRPDAEFEEPFTQIGAVRELRDGRVLVSDPRDKTVQLVDLKTGSATAVGREGSGPGEYAMPLALIGVPGDSTLVYDPLNQRFLFVLPNGKPGGFYSPQREEVTEQRGNRIGGMRFGPGGIRGVDSRGRLYYQAANFTIGPNGPQTADSAAIARLDRATGRVDTIAFIRTPRPNVNASGGSGAERRVSVMIGPPNPFTPLDQWTVTPDGRVVIARAGDYHLDIINPDGRRVAGPPVQFERIRVTDKDRKEWRENLRNSQNIAMSRTNVNGRVTASASAGAPTDVPEPTDWPDVKPPFTQNAIFSAPNGTVWVQRSRPAGDRVPVYDVFDAQGRMTGRIALPAGGRLLGFGNGTVYVARNDEDDLQYLQRFRMP